MKITVLTLRSRGACDEQVAIFSREWPGGCEATEATVLRAIELGLNFEWAARKLLPEEARAEFNGAENAAYDELVRSTAPARAERVFDREKARELLASVGGYAEYLRAYDAADAKYLKATEAERNKYRRAIGFAFLAACKGL